MAEAVGLVAGGINIGTVAVQIISSILKIRSYLEQVRDAPEDIHDLIEELENVCNLLADNAVRSILRLYALNRDAGNESEGPLLLLLDSPRMCNTQYENPSTDPGAWTEG